MVEKKDLSIIVGYTFGIISIVMAFFTPLVGLVFGIIGLVQSKKQKTDISKKAKKLNIIGIILSVVILIASMAATWYLSTKGINPLSSFPLK